MSNFRRGNPNERAGKMGLPFIKDSYVQKDVTAPVKGNLQGSAEKRVSKIVPSRGNHWGSYSKLPPKGPPASTSWRATSRPMPNKPPGKGR